MKKTYYLNEVLKMKIKNFTGFAALHEAIKLGLVHPEYMKACDCGRNKYLFTEADIKALKNMNLLTVRQITKMGINGLMHHETIKDRVEDGTLKAFRYNIGKNEKILIPEKEIIKFNKKYNKINV